MIESRRESRASLQVLHPERGSVASLFGSLHKYLRFWQKIAVFGKFKADSRSLEGLGQQLSRRFPPNAFKKAQFKASDLLEWRLCFSFAKPKTAIFCQNLEFFSHAVPLRLSEASKQAKTLRRRKPYVSSWRLSGIREKRRLVKPRGRYSWLVGSRIGETSPWPVAVRPGETSPWPHGRPWPWLLAVAFATAREGLLPPPTGPRGASSRREA